MGPGSGNRLTLGHMNVLESTIEGAVAYAVDWEATAAWVQAAGAIGALGLAIWIPRRDWRQKRTVFRDTVLAYATMVRDAVWAQAVHEGTFNDEVSRLQVQELEIEIDLPRVLTALEELPLAQLESAGAVNSAVRLIGAARTFLATPVSSPLTVQEATEILINGYTPRRFAADQVMLRHRQLHACLTDRLAARSRLSLKLAGKVTSASRP